MFRIFTKSLLTICLCILFTSSAFATEVQDKSTIFTLDKKEYKTHGINSMLDSNPFIFINNNIYMQTKYLAYSCGITDDGIEYNPESKTIKLTSGLTNVSLQIDTKILVKNNEINNIDYVPIIQNNVVFLPAKLVCEALGYDFIYDETNKTITIKPNMSAEEEKVINIVKNIYSKEFRINKEKYVSLYNPRYKKEVERLFVTNKNNECKVYNLVVTKIDDKNATVLYDLEVYTNHKLVRKLVQECELINHENLGWKIECFTAKKVEFFE